MNIEPALVGKVAAAVRGERLKSAEPSDTVLALAVIRAAFDWQPIKDAPKDGSAVWGTNGFRIVRIIGKPFYCSEGKPFWQEEGSDNLWFTITHYLSMIPLPDGK